MCAQNFKSFRIQRIKTKLMGLSPSSEKPYTQAWNLLTELLTIKTISLRNCEWARKYIAERLRDRYTDKLTVAELDQLEELFAKAEQRRIRRKEKKLAAKAEGTSADTPRKRGRPPKSPPVPVAPGPSPIALWQEMLDRQKENPNGTEG